jgi:hypothetical protein
MCGHSLALVSAFFASLCALPAMIKIMLAAFFRTRAASLRAQMADFVYEI